MAASTQAVHSRYNRSEKGKARDLRRRTPDNKSRVRTWQFTEKGKESLKAACRRFSEKRRAWLQAEKVRRGCVDCGYNKHPAALDFDHVEGTKLFNLSKVARSLEVLKAEIAKCVVRCSLIDQEVGLGMVRDLMERLASLQERAVDGLVVSVHRPSGTPRATPRFNLSDAGRRSRR